jgi:hypothetical protein
VFSSFESWVIEGTERWGAKEPMERSGEQGLGGCREEKLEFHGEPWLLKRKKGKQSR